MNESSAGGCTTKLEGQEQRDCEVLFKAGKREAVESGIKAGVSRSNVTVWRWIFQASGKAGIEAAGCVCVCAGSSIEASRGRVGPKRERDGERPRTANEFCDQQ